MLAKNHFGIPLIVRPEDFSSPHLDELSGMTYLSYYMNVDSPGYNATKRNINALLTGSPVDNFTVSVCGVGGVFGVCGVCGVFGVCSVFGVFSVSVPLPH